MAEGGSGRIDDLPGMSVAERGFTSHRLTAADLRDDVIAALGAEAGPGVVVDWHPRHAMRLGLLAAALPDAKFVVVSRRPALAISSLFEAWGTQRFASVPDLPGWWGDPWAFPLVDGWRDLIGAPLAQVCAAQWAGITTSMLEDLQSLAADRWTVASYGALLEDPELECERVAKELGLEWSGELPDPLPLTATCVSEPDPTKWVRSWSEVAVALPDIEDTVQRFRDVVLERRPDADWPDLEAPALEPEAPEVRPSAGTPFSSAHTSTMPMLLDQAGCSLLVTTYKSGHVILARADGERLNTEFTHVDRPMGVAAVGSRLAIGSAEAILGFTTQPGLAPRVPAARPVDAPYVPRSVVITGDIQIHDMAYADDGSLYFVNTRFSCLCRQDIDYSFVPVWRPAWLPGLADGDLCHLNGLAMVDGAPRYVTTLAQTDTPGGWRELKGTSGVIIDITDDRVVAEGLSMPHSPRWHDGALWVLESGKGQLNRVDVTTGQVTPIAELPGFTRGLSFIGPYALVGLSQVRESVFSSLPITARAGERNCGVWMVDTRTGEVGGFLKFDGVVQEIFEVTVLPSRWPVIVRDEGIARDSFVLPDEAIRQVVQVG